MMYWEYYAIAGIFAFVLGIFCSVTPKRISKNVENGDSQLFQNCMGVWLAILINRQHTPRAVKRFSNRMRLLTVGLDDEEHLTNFIGISALVEVGEIDLESYRGQDDYFRRWKSNWRRRKYALTAVKTDLEDWGAANFDSWFEKIQAEDWKTFIDLSSGGRL